MSKAQSSPPSLQLIWRAIFCVTLRSLFCCEIVLALITWGLKKIVKNLTWQDIKTYKTQQWNCTIKKFFIYLDIAITLHNSHINYKLEKSEKVM